MALGKGENAEMGGLVSNSAIWCAEGLGVPFPNLISKENLPSKCKLRNILEESRFSNSECVEMELRSKS